MKRPTCFWQAWPRRSWFPCTASSVSILPSACFPGWHTTIFPPYFVAGAIYSGFAMVLSLVIPVRKLYHLDDFITIRHLDLHGEGHACHRA